MGLDWNQNGLELECARNGNENGLALEIGMVMGLLWELKLVGEWNWNGNGLVMGIEMGWGMELEW